MMFSNLKERNLLIVWWFFFLICVPQISFSAQAPQRKSFRWGYYKSEKLLSCLELTVSPRNPSEVLSAQKMYYVADADPYQKCLERDTYYAIVPLPGETKIGCYPVATHLNQVLYPYPVKSKKDLFYCLSHQGEKYGFKAEQRLQLERQAFKDLALCSNQRLKSGDLGLKKFIENNLDVFGFYANYLLRPNGTDLPRDAAKITDFGRQVHALGLGKDKNYLRLEQLLQEGADQAEVLHYIAEHEGELSEYFSHSMDMILGDDDYAKIQVVKSQLQLLQRLHEDVERDGQLSLEEGRSVVKKGLTWAIEGQERMRTGHVDYPRILQRDAVKTTADGSNRPLLFQWQGDIYFFKQKLGSGLCRDVFEVEDIHGHRFAGSYNEVDAMRSDHEMSLLHKEAHILNRIKLLDDTQSTGLVKTYLNYVSPVDHSVTFLHHLYDGDLFSIAEQLTVRQQFKVAQNLLMGLLKLHGHGLAHGDLKPENVLVRKGVGEDVDAVLADFNLSYLIKDSLEDGDGGTSEYYPPEYMETMVAKDILKRKFLDREEISDRRVAKTMEGLPRLLLDPNIAFGRDMHKFYQLSLKRDMWSLGITLMEMISGQRPAWATSGKGHEHISRLARLGQKDIDREIVRLIPHSHPLRMLIVGLLQLHPDHRLSATQAIGLFSPRQRRVRQ